MWQRACAEWGGQEDFPGKTDKQAGNGGLGKVRCEWQGRGRRISGKGNDFPDFPAARTRVQPPSSLTCTAALTSLPISLLPSGPFQSALPTAARATL